MSSPWLVSGIFCECGLGLGCLWTSTRGIFWELEEVTISLASRKFRASCRFTQSLAIMMSWMVVVFTSPFFLDAGTLGIYSLPQRRPYFLFSVQERWLFLGIHNQHFAGHAPDIDRAQERWFRRELNVQIDSASRANISVLNVVLVMHAPVWLESSGVGTRLSELFQFLSGAPFHVHALIAGDLHYYSRHQSQAGVALIVSGGGGAFTHSTAHTPSTLEFEPFSNAVDAQKFTAHSASFYPTKWESHKMALGLLWVGFQKPLLWLFSLLMSPSLYALFVACVSGANQTQRNDEGPPSPSKRPARSGFMDHYWNDVLPRHQHLKNQTFTLFCASGALFSTTLMFFSFASWSSMIVWFLAWVILWILYFWRDLWTFRDIVIEAIFAMKDAYHVSLLLERIYAFHLASVDSWKLTSAIEVVVCGIFFYKRSYVSRNQGSWSLLLKIWQFGIDLAAMSRFYYSEPSTTMTNEVMFILLHHVHIEMMFYFQDLLLGLLSLFPPLRVVLEIIFHLYFRDSERSLSALTGDIFRLFTLDHVSFLVIVLAISLSVTWWFYGRFHQLNNQKLRDYGFHVWDCFSSLGILVAISWIEPFGFLRNLIFAAFFAIGGSFLMCTIATSLSFTKSRHLDRSLPAPIPIVVRFLLHVIITTLTGLLCINVLLFLLHLLGLVTDHVSILGNEDYNHFLRMAVNDFDLTVYAIGFHGSPEFPEYSTSIPGNSGLYSPDITDWTDTNLFLIDKVTFKAL
mmetsp:Transcript_42182/g.106415  ORF Transcript_42182/g.106415 Transcript_42182/m.106415 type:complete len:741 (+) Transcript_42182:840-3062(+)